MRAIMSIFVVAAVITSTISETEIPNTKERIIYEVGKSQEELSYSDEEIDLVSLITMAEAESESDKGKRLVIDTILNRVDSEYFPDTIEDVVYQKNQYSCVLSGRLDRCYVQEDIRRLVIEEMIDRTDSEVIFFRLDDYPIYGSPMFIEGNHYFSSYE